MTKREFFAVDDYGQGGVWIAIQATSGEAIKRKYPELDVFDEPPPFLTSDVIERTRLNRTYDVDDEPTGYLATIVADRQR